MNNGMVSRGSWPGEARPSVSVGDDAAGVGDTVDELTWIPSATLEDIGVVREKKDVTFTMANGQAITRSIGFAILRVGPSFTINEVVFGEPGGMTLLGARTLEGLALAVDFRRKRLVAAGPLPVAPLHS